MLHDLAIIENFYNETTWAKYMGVKKTFEQLKKEAEEEIRKWSPIQMQQVQGWISSLELMCRRLGSGSQFQETYSIFWIRLRQTMTEVEPYFNSTKETLESLTLREERQDPSSKYGKLYKMYKDIVDKIHDIESSFSEDELLTIEYERHSQCHVFQEDYLKRGHIKKDGSFAFKKTSKAGVSLEDINEAIVRTLRSHTSETQMAISFSQRIAVKTTELKGYVDHWIRSP